MTPFVRSKALWSFLRSLRWRYNCNRRWILLLLLLVPIVATMMSNRSLRTHSLLSEHVDTQLAIVPIGPTW
jgi:hypothetical protein